jgi:hypothetical protein
MISFLAIIFVNPPLILIPCSNSFRAIQWTKNKGMNVERQIHWTCYGSWIRAITIHDPFNSIEHRRVDSIGQEVFVQVLQRETIAHRVKCTIQ